MADTATVSATVATTGAPPAMHHWQGDFMEAVGLVLLGVFALILLRAQFDKKSKIDLTYVLIDAQLGKVTLAKFGGLLALLASTWVFFYLPISGHFDSTYAVGYVAVWVAGKVATDFALNKGSP